MNFFDPWNLVYFAGFAVFYWIRHVFIQRTKKEKKIIRRIDAQEKALLIGITPGSLLLPLLYLFTPFLAFADYRISEYAPWLGLLLMAGSLWLFWRSHADLGQNWSVSLEIREGHELVRQGVYRFIRHPMYAALWLWSIAQGLLLANWLAGWSMLPAFALMYFLRIPREEKLMREQFGQRYEEYMQETGRLLPKRKSGHLVRMVC